MNRFKVSLPGFKYTVLIDSADKVHPSRGWIGQGKGKPRKPKTDYRAELRDDMVLEAHSEHDARAAFIKAAGITNTARYGEMTAEPTEAPLTFA